MNEVIQQVELWVRTNALRLRTRGVFIDEANVARKGSNMTGVSTVGFEYEGITVSYTVWERQIPISETIVENYAIKKTIVKEEREIKSLNEIDNDLNKISERLLCHVFLKMKPDPKFIDIRDLR